MTPTSSRVGEHRQLRDVGEPHALERREQRVVGRDADDAAVLGAARDQVAQVAVVATREQTLVDHPLVVVDLAQVARAGVADEADDALRLGLRAAIAQRGGEQRAGRRAAEDALRALAARAPSRSSLRRGSSRRRSHPRGRRSPGRSPRRCPRRPTSPALPTTPLFTYSARIEPSGSASTKASDGCTARKNRVSPVMVPAEPTPTTMASTSMAHLRPDLRRRSRLVRERIGRVVELVGKESAANVGAQGAAPCPGNSRDDPCPRRCA